MKLNVLAFSAAAILVSGNALAFPLPSAGETPATRAVGNPLAEDGAVDFTSIVALNNCSGSLVRFVTSLGSDKAMVLTNGHCLEGGFLKPGEVRVNTPSTRTFKLLSKDGNSSLATLHATQVMYATMTKTDMTLYQLAETFDEIEQKHSTPALTLSNRRPEDGRKITIASGYWRKLYSCSISGFAHSLKEADWTFVDSIRYSEPGCDTIGGTSGSPIIDSETLEVIGVNNTSNESGEECTMNNPCEVDAEGKVTVSEGTSYGQQTFWVYGRLNNKNEIDLAAADCQLAK